MTYVFCSYLSSFPTHGWSKDAKGLALVLMVPDYQDWGVVDNDGFLMQKKQVRFREWTEIVECDASTASGLV